MTRTYAAKRLLEHGPLTFSQLVEITGWKSRQVESTIYAMVDQGDLCTLSELGTRRRLYSLAS